MINKNHKRWEKKINSKFVRYYETKIQNSIFGRLILEIYWGRKDSRFGGKKMIAGESIEELNDKILTIHKKITMKLLFSACFRLKTRATVFLL